MYIAMFCTGIIVAYVVNWRMALVVSVIGEFSSFCSSVDDTD